MSLDPNKTYLTWNGSEFPNSSNAQFKAPAGSSIDWGDGTVESFEAASGTVNAHTYTDGKDTHTIAISGLTEIVNVAFWMCSSLTNVTIGNGVTRIGDEAFMACSSLMSVTIPDSVTSIGDSAFSSCNSLTSVTIPDSVTSISVGTFAGCNSLTSVTIPDGVTSIGNAAFFECSSLTSVTIGNSVTSIGNSVFGGCISLQSIVIFAETPPTLGVDSIPSNVQSIYVTQSSKSAYQAATNWNAFSSKIVSDNLYLSFIRYTQGLKQYVAGEIEESETRIDEKLEEQKVDLTDYVKFTDYAKPNKGGVIKSSKQYAFIVADTGATNADILRIDEYTRMLDGAFIGKGTLENAKYDIVKRAITTNTETLTASEQLNAQKWLGVDDRFAVINIALEQSGLLKKYKQPITQEYNERVTADGLNVLDGSKAKLKKVVGNTVACKQLLDESKILVGEFTDTTIRITSVDGNTIKIGSGVNYTGNGIASSGHKLKELCPSLKLGETYYLNGENNNSLASASIFIVGAEIQWDFGTAKEITQAMLDGAVYLRSVPQQGGITVTITNLRITKEQNTPWQPYFTGLKSSSFSGIESTNADGTETSTLAFPKTPTPLGTTIDFETKKITDYGVDLVLTGEENVSDSGYLSGWNTIYLIGVLPTKEVKAPGICTDGYVVSGTGSWIAENTILIGNNNKNIHWCGILEKLGYATKGTQLSTDEMTTAIANFKAYLAQRYAAGNPVIIRYISSTLQSETDFTTDNKYTVYKGGTEKVLDNDGAEYGAENTLTQDYILVTEVK